MQFQPNIVFDVGKVLFDYNPAVIIRNLVPDSPFQKEYQQHLFESSIWEDLDQGLLSPSEAKDALVKTYSFMKPNEVANLIENFWKYLTLIPQSKALFEELHQLGYPLYILSNFQEDAFQKLLFENPFMNLANGMVVSGRIKLKKPNRDIYDYLFTTYQLNPADCIFIDDRAENIETSVALGMQGILFTSFEEVKARLFSLLSVTTRQ